MVALGAAFAAGAETAPSSLSATDEREFQLVVVGADGKPVPHAAVEFRVSPPPTAEQVIVGKLGKRTSNVASITTDENGIMKVSLAKQPKSLWLSVIMPGYGPYMARWEPENNAQSIPGELKAELDAAWSVGGLVVDSNGKPVEGVKIHPHIEFKKPPDDRSQLAIGNTATTDKEGKWRFDSVPISMPEVSVGLDHSAFKRESKTLAKAAFSIERGAEPAAKIVLDRGLVVSGKVADEEGKPIEGALVRTRSRQAKTGEDGVYQLSGCEAGDARVVVSAKGKAMDLKEVRVAEAMQAVDFQMQPGGSIRIRVLDSEGKPAPRARIFFQKWKGRYEYWEFEKVNQYANKDGIWEWHEAPLDSFEADICPPNGMQMPDQPLIARQEEYVFKTLPMLVISGAVIDGETKAPIKLFKVIPGLRFNAERATYWESDHSFSAADGKYQIKQDREQFAFGVQIVADGYLPAVSRDIKSDEGKVTIDFALKKGGMPVVAKIEPPKGFKGELNWQFAEVEIQPYVPTVPRPDPPRIPANISGDEAKSQAWMNEWLQTDAGKTWAVWQRAVESNERHRETDTRIMGTVDRDGKLHIVNVSEGEYSLSVRFSHGARVGYISDCHFTVPAADSDKRDQELDLGVLKLEAGQ